MDCKTGFIYENLYPEEVEQIERDLGRKLVPLKEKEVKKLKPLSKRKRKWLMKNGVCPCGSKKSFKKCCWKKYK